jgi:TrmH family RNA methyltransferase
MGAVRNVSSRGNPLLVRVRKLASDAAAYRKFGQVWIEGDHLCKAYLQRRGPAPQAVVTEEAWARPAMRELAGACDDVVVVPAALMDELSALESPPVVAFVVPWTAAGRIAPSEATVVLDRVQDAGNVGAILRSASAFGFTQVVALKGTAALWSPKVLRAGMGAHFGLALVEGVEAVEGLQVPMIAASSHAATALHEARLPWPCAWVLGHEGQGVSRELIDRCELQLRIAQPGGEESLNVAAAAAVCLYESSRQRMA